MNSTNIVLLVFLLYWLLVMFLDRRGTLGKHNITAYGPILMLRTTKGQGFLDRLAVHKKFWRTFANIGIPAMLIGMLAMFILVLVIDYSTIMAFQTKTVPPPNEYTGLRGALAIPGINPLIPFIYGTVALIVTLVVHEFSHAILCKVEGIRVKSMGILLALIPIGGFAEPDDEQLLGKKEEKSDTEAAEQAEPKKLATRSERVRVLTAGVMANFVTSLIAFILFFSLLGYLSPLGNVMVTDIVPGYPAEQAGVRQNMILTGIDDKEVNSAHDFLFYAKTLEPGSNVTLHLIEGRVRKEINLIAAGSNVTRAGVRVFKVVEGSPAQIAGIKEGMVLVRINDTEIRGIGDFVGFMNSTTQGQKVDAYLLSNSSVNASTEIFNNVELSKNPDGGVDRGFLGVIYSPEEGAISYSIGVGIDQVPAKNYLNMLKGIPSSLTGLSGWLQILILPFIVKNFFGAPSFSGLITDFYEPTGWAAPLGIGIFLVLNALLWIGWMNFYAGLFNCLPAVPLDGGHVFRDVVTSSLSRIMGDGEKVERLSSAIAVLFAVLILMSFVFVMIAPYAAHGF